MHTTLTLVTKPAGTVAAARPKHACTAGRISWMTSAESVTVPTFHDRWPLRSAT